MNRYTHRDRIDEVQERFVRSGDIAGAAYAAIGDLALLRSDERRATAALLCACAGMREYAQALLAGTGLRHAAAQCAQAAIDAFSDEWPAALSRFSLRCDALEDDPLIWACATIFLARCELLGAHFPAAIARLDRAATSIENESPGLARRAALWHAYALQETGQDSAARAIVERAPDNHGFPATAILERAVAARFGEATQIDSRDCLMRFDDAYVYAAAVLAPSSRRFADVVWLISFLEPRCYEPILQPTFAVAAAPFEAESGARTFVERIEKAARRTGNRATELYASLARVRRDAVRGHGSGASRQCAAIAHEFRSLGFSRAAGLALDTMMHSGKAPLTDRRPARKLTHRQREVAELLRSGATNRQIAAHLHISEHTVERHVSAILIRLELRSRWQLAGADFPQEILSLD